jgi:hypothetical protein
VVRGMFGLAAARDNEKTRQIKNHPTAPNAVSGPCRAVVEAQLAVGGQGRGRANQTMERRRAMFALDATVESRVRRAGNLAQVEAKEPNEAQGTRQGKAPHHCRHRERSRNQQPGMRDAVGCASQKKTDGNQEAGPRGMQSGKRKMETTSD